MFFELRGAFVALVGGRVGRLKGVGCACLRLLGKLGTPFICSLADLKVRPTNVLAFTLGGDRVVTHSGSIAQIHYDNDIVKSDPPISSNHDRLIHGVVGDGLT